MDAIPAFENAPGLGTEVVVLPAGECLIGGRGSGEPSWTGVVAVGLSIELIDDSRFELSASPGLGAPTSIFENDRLREGERKEAGDSDDWRSLDIFNNVSGASRFSSVRDSGIGRDWALVDEW